jgi:hypothetical protein
MKFSCRRELQTEPLSHHEAHEGHEGFGNYYSSISYFVLFATFVVKCLSRFWLRRCRPGIFVTFVLQVVFLVAALPRYVLRASAVSVPKICASRANDHG